MCTLGSHITLEEDVRAYISLFRAKIRGLHKTRANCAQGSCHCDLQIAIFSLEFSSGRAVAPLRGWALPGLNAERIDDRLSYLRRHLRG